MLRKIGLALVVAVPIVTTSAILAVDNSIVLACTISGVGAAKVESFSAVLCEQAAAQLHDVSGRPVTIKEIDALASAAGWLRLDVEIKSPQAAVARASWGGTSTPAGQSAELDVGIDDSTLNQSTAAMLVQVLLNGTPYLAD